MSYFCRNLSPMLAIEISINDSAPIVVAADDYLLASLSYGVNAKHRSDYILAFGGDDTYSYRWIDQMPQEGDKVLIRVVDVSIDKLTPPKRIIRRDREKMKQEYERLKQELQNKLDNYEYTHDYDEYSYDLDEIEHDPYVLISILSALHPGEWTLSDVEDTLGMLFEKQYILTETVTSEIRYRTETVIKERHAKDPVTGVYLYDEYGDPVMEEYEDEEEVPYTYYKCHVELENFNLSHVPVYIMSEEQLSAYAVYISTLGNRPDLFPDSEYIPKRENGYTDYEIPPEALEDEVFAAMITEAEKYLGYPYVWGGSNPNTSFDCSGFVSWVINHSGWNVGRLGAQGLCNICTLVSSSNVKPGDLVFFEGTYDTDGVSHVGIYVGNNMMIHCGDPISYTNLNSSYWQTHFYAYGRLP